MHHAVPQWGLHVSAQSAGRSQRAFLEAVASGVSLSAGRRRLMMLSTTAKNEASRAKRIKWTNEITFVALCVMWSASSPSAAQGPPYLRACSRDVRCLTNVPLLYSSKAVRSSSSVFITMGPYQATGSPIGRPDQAGIGQAPLRRDHNLVARLEQDEHPVANERLSLHVKVIRPLHLIGERVFLLAEVALALDHVGEGRVSRLVGWKCSEPGGTVTSR